jgi:hypothetical protein
MTDHAEQLRYLSRKLQELHSHVLAAERQFHPELSALALLDKLTNDPHWAWLRVVSSLVAEIDHVLASDHVPTADDVAVVATRIRGMLFGEEDLREEDFIERYRPLLQLDPAIASIHGQLRGYLKNVAPESENESERLHARHQWAMRCKHRVR